MSEEAQASRLPEPAEVRKARRMALLERLVAAKAAGEIPKLAGRPVRVNG